MPRSTQFLIPKLLLGHTLAGCKFRSFGNILHNWQGVNTAQLIVSCIFEKVLSFDKYTVREFPNTKVETYFFRVLPWPSTCLTIQNHAYKTQIWFSLPVSNKHTH